jgi:hypothetical protein
MYSAGVITTTVDEKNAEKSSSICMIIAVLFGIGFAITVIGYIATPLQGNITGSPLDYNLSNSTTPLPSSTTESSAAADESTSKKWLNALAVFAALLGLLGIIAYIRHRRSQRD